MPTTVSEAQRRVWNEKVDRKIGRPARREYNAARRDAARKASDATHDLLAMALAMAVDEDGGSVEIPEEAKRAYLDRIGEISGAGPYPG